MRLIVGVDGSDGAMQALEEVAARDGVDEVTVAVYSTDERLASVEAAVRDHLEALALEATIEVIEDDPGGTLVDMAERDGYDRIVLSGGHMSPLGKIQLDSVIEFVLLNAHTTVTLIR